MQVYGLIGDPVEHSISPQMQNCAFREKEMEAFYGRFQVKEKDLKKAAEGIRALGISGVNVTIPHKEKIIELLDQVDEKAQRIGSVNTIKREGNSLIGYCTDGQAGVNPLKQEIDLKGKTGLILGAGGAARAISFELVEEQIGKLWIANRSRKRAEILCRGLRDQGGKCKALDLKEIREKAREADFVVNCTPVGMWPDTEETLLEEKEFHKKSIVEDIVYNPIQTRFLREAEKAGCKTIGGVEMLVLQGAKAFEIWTSEEAPVDKMRETAYRELENG